MNFNHLVSTPMKRETCHKTKNTEFKHHWQPTGAIEAAVGGEFVGVGFYCKKCDKRHWSFLPIEDFKLHEKNIQLGISKKK